MDGKDIISVRREAPAGTESPHAGWSRRRFLAQSLIAAAVAPPFARAAAGPFVDIPPDTGSKPPGDGDAKDTGSGAVRSGSDLNNRLTTLVYINGRGPYHFLVDTGAERTLIAADLAAELTLQRGNKVIVEGIVGGRPTDLVQIESLQIGRLICPNLDVPVLPRGMLNVDGYLGLDVLDRRRVILDFRARTITVTKPQGFFSSLFFHGDDAVVHTLGSSGRLRASDCHVDGVRAAAFIDTGAEVSVCNQALAELLQQRAAHRQVVRGPVGIYGVTGGRIIGLDTNVEEIVLGPLKMTYTELIVAELEVFKVWGLSREPALLFGMDCLRRFSRVSIDYGRKELRFELAKAQLPQPLEAGLSRPLLG
ncbi:MAG TPA: retroviral-like aspartic protease family protein [Steroidobacteraceae bacterium]|jgi:predicted aspartyl protease